MMMLSENVRVGLSSVRKSRFRSFFTMLGIIIGVVSVITIVSLGEGAKRQIASQASELGNNLITVRPGKVVNRDSSDGISAVNLFSGVGTRTLTEQDVDSIKQSSHVESVALLSTVSGLASYEGNVFKEGTVIATSEDMATIINHDTVFGSFFSGSEVNKKIAVIGPGVAEKLFGEAIPIGKIVKIRNHEFIVQGIFERFPSVAATTGVDFNDTIFIPYSVAKTISGGNGSMSINEMLVKPSDSQNIDQTIEELTNVLRQNHGGQEDFTILKQDEAAAATDSMLQTLTRMIIVMAGVTLFVGGVGIMNIMMAMVSERTREIGIRKAIGATNSQIRSQFMIEATVLSIWGVGIGILIAGVINLILRILTDLQPVITWQPVVAAGLISICVGITFGVIPAIKAARKDPIDSLRSR